MLGLDVGVTEPDVAVNIVDVAVTALDVAVVNVVALDFDVFINNLVESRLHTQLPSQLHAKHFEALHKNLFARYVANAMYIV